MDPDRFNLSGLEELRDLDEVSPGFSIFGSDPTIGASDSGVNAAEDLAKILKEGDGIGALSPIKDSGDEVDGELVEHCLFGNSQGTEKGAIETGEIDIGGNEGLEGHKPHLRRFLIQGVPAGANTLGNDPNVPPGGRQPKSFILPREKYSDLQNEADDPIFSFGGVRVSGWPSPRGGILSHAGPTCFSQTAGIEKLPVTVLHQRNFNAALLEEKAGKAEGHKKEEDGANLVSFLGEIKEKTNVERDGDGSKGGERGSESGTGRPRGESEGEEESETEEAEEAEEAEEEDEVAFTTECTGSHDESGDPIIVIKECPKGRSTLIHDELMDAWKISISLDLKVALCGWCGYGVRGDVSGHLRRTHYMNGVPRELGDISKRYLESKMMKNFVHGTERAEREGEFLRQPVQGLRVFPGYVCRLAVEEGKEDVIMCGYACLQKSSIEQHGRDKHNIAQKNHRVSESGGDRYKEVSVQTISNGKERSYFAVRGVVEGEHAKKIRGRITSSLPKEELKKLIEAGTDAVDRVMNSTSGESAACGDSSDTRCRDLFLRGTRWPQYAAGMDSTIVELYVAGPRLCSWKEVLISVACHVYLQRVIAIVEDGDYVTRRYLLSWNGGEVVGRKAFGCTQEPQTLKRYGDLLARLVLMSWRRAMDGRRFSSFRKLPKVAKEALFRLNATLLHPSLSGDEADIQESLHCVLKSLLCVPLKPTSPRRDHVAGEFLMLGNMSAKHGWYGPAKAGHMVAALHYACRCVVYEEIRKAELESMDETFFDLCRLVTTTRNTPFCAMNEIMALASSVQRSESWALPKVTWSLRDENGMSMVIEGEKVSIKELRKGLRKHVGRAERFFKEHVLLGMDVSEVEWDWVVDNMKDRLRNGAAGYGLTSVNCNRRLGGTMRPRLVTHILQDDKLRLRFAGQDPYGGSAEKKEIRWQMHTARAWLADVFKFVEMILPIIHIAYGQPARAEELATVSILNSKSGGHTRNVYWAFDTIMFLIRYHKGQSISQKSRPVPRFLPTELVPIFLQYIALVKPLEAVLAGVSFGGEKAKNAHLHYLFCKNGKRLEGKQVCEIFQRQMNHIIGFELGIANYRHVCIAFMRALIKNKQLPKGFGEETEGSYLGHKKKEEDDDVLDAQSGHCSDLAKRFYGISDQDLREYTAREVFSYRLATGDWGLVIGYPEKLLKSWRRRHELLELREGDNLENAEGSDDDDDDEEDYYFERSMKGDGDGDGDGDDDDNDGGSRKFRKDKNRRSRRRRHRHRRTVLLKRTHGDDDYSPERKKLMTSRWKPSGAIHTSSLSPRASAYLRKRLQGFLKDSSAEFTSGHQLLAVREVLRRREDLLIVMPTGSGKTLTYALPAWIEQYFLHEARTSRGKHLDMMTALAKKMVTIVIVPLVALTDDLKRRCSSWGVETGTWAEREAHPTLLLVSVEIVDSLTFREYCGALAAKECLSRIVVEESHLRITWQGFRPQMHTLSGARPVFPVPLVLLTATLPPTLEAELSVGFSSHYKVIRMEETTRRNLRYRVLKVDEAGRNSVPEQVGRNIVYKKTLEVLSKFAFSPERKLEDRAIVYCTTHAECQEIWNAFTATVGDGKENGTTDSPATIAAAMYHRGLDEEDRRKYEKKWHEGRAIVMIATCAFGTGIDHPSVRLVVHVGMSYSLLDYAQETGRAGRDGLFAECVLITHRVYKDYFERCARQSADISRGIVSEVEKSDERKGRDRIEYRGGVGGLVGIWDDEGGVRYWDEEEGEGEEKGKGELESPRLNRVIKDATSMFEMIYSNQVICRRQQLHDYLDGRGENCLTAGQGSSTLCDVCEFEMKRIDEGSKGKQGEGERGEEEQDDGADLEDIMEGLNRDMREEPGVLVSQSTEKAREARHVAEYTKSRAIEAGEKLSRYCIYCAVKAGRLELHRESQCDGMDSLICYRCSARGHSRRECPVTKRVCTFSETPPCCYKCGVNHGAGKWGGNCTTRYEIARDVVLTLWNTDRNWLITHFPDLRAIPNMMQFGKWLYGRTRGTRVVRVLHVFVSWCEEKGI